MITDGERELLREQVSDGAIDAVAALPRGRVLIADSTRRLSIYEIASGAALASRDAASRVRALRVSGDGDRAIALPFIDRRDEPVLYDFTRAMAPIQLTGHRRQVYAAKFVRGDREILTASTDGSARLWDGSTGQLRQTLDGSDGFRMDAALSPDGAMVVTAAGDGSLRFWDMVWRLRAQRARPWGPLRG